MDKDEMRQALDSLGWKQSELARKLDVSDTTVSRWATGEPIPRWLAEYLGVMQELDRLHRLYVKPPKLVKEVTTNSAVGMTDAPKVHGRASRIAKKVNELGEDGLLAMSSDS